MIGPKLNAYYYLLN